MTTGALVQQGYDYSPEQLSELSWALRFTPTVCMIGAVIGLATQTPAIHFTLAGLGMIWFWFPASHPFDLFYNRVLRPLWNGVRLPPNPLPRRIACFLGGSMNLGIGIAFVQGVPAVAWVLGAVLITLQLVVISTHFCVASWMVEGLLRLFGRWAAPVAPERCRALVEGGGVLVDVREPDEFAREHLPSARNIPLATVVGGLAAEKDACLVLYCQSGLRSQRAAQMLKRAGFPNVHNLGGMERWNA